VDGGAHTPPICVLSPPFTVQIVDPCGFDNYIKTAPINTIMRQPQLKSQSLTLSAEMGQKWPWVDFVDDSISNVEYGTGLCGDIEYWVTDRFDMSTDLVSFSGVAPA